MTEASVPAHKLVKRRIVRFIAESSAWLVRHVPLRCTYLLADAVSGLIYLLNPGRQRMADANLVATFGDRLTPDERRRIRWFVTMNMTRTMVELLRIPVMGPSELGAMLRIERPEHFEQAAALGRGVILLTAHYGNYEMIGPALRRMGHQISAVVRDSHDAPTAAVINESREGGGSQIIRRDEVRTMFRTLQGGGTMVILPDQWAKTGGIIVDFMGRPASTFTGPATMALRTGAVIVPCFARRTEDSRIVAEFLPHFEIEDTGDRDADVRAGTQLVNDVIGRQIMRRPAQWLWLHKRWRPEDEVAAAEAAAD